MKACSVVLRFFLMIMYSSYALCDDGVSEAEFGIGTFNHYLIENERRRFETLNNDYAVDLMLALIELWANEKRLDVKSLDSLMVRRIQSIEATLQGSFEDARRTYHQFPASYRTFIELMQPALHTIETLPLGTLDQRKSFIKKVVQCAMEDGINNKTFAAGIIQQLDGRTRERIASSHLNASTHPKLRNGFPPIVSGGYQYHAEDIIRVYLHMVSMDAIDREKRFFNHDDFPEIPRSISELTMRDARGFLGFRGDDGTLYVAGIDKQSMVFTVEPIEGDLSQKIKQYFEGKDHFPPRVVRSSRSGDAKRLEPKVVGPLEHPGNEAMAPLRRYSRAFALLYQDKSYGPLTPLSPEAFGRSLDHSRSSFPTLTDLSVMYDSLFSE